MPNRTAARRASYRACAWLGAALVSPLAAADATAQSREQAAEQFSPRWMYELKAGYTYPELDGYDTFYGDDRETSFAVAGGYRINDLLEIAAEIAHMRDEGLGTDAAGELSGAEVTLRLVPLHVFATYVHQPRAERRLVPYAGLGFAVVWYDQGVELQDSRDGRTDVGVSARIGVRWLLGQKGTRASRRNGSIYSRSYAFAEAQQVDADVDDIELGGTTYTIGFRFELEIPGR
jgi:opacity protein-like surface antigen